MTYLNAEIINNFFQSSIGNALELVNGLSYEDEHTQLLFYKRLCENLSYYFSTSFPGEIESDSLSYEKCDIKFL